MIIQIESKSKKGNNDFMYARMVLFNYPSDNYYIHSFVQFFQGWSLESRRSDRLLPHREISPLPKTKAPKQANQPDQPD